MRHAPVAFEPLYPERPPTRFISETGRLRRSIPDQDIHDRILAVVRAGGGAVVAIRLGEWWVRQLYGLHGMLPVRLFGITILPSDDEYDIDPLDHVPE